MHISLDYHSSRFLKMKLRSRVGAIKYGVLIRISNTSFKYRQKNHLYSLINSSQTPKASPPSSSPQALQKQVGGEYGFQEEGRKGVDAELLVVVLCYVLI